MNRFLFQQWIPCHAFWGVHLISPVVSWQQSIQWLCKCLLFSQRCWQAMPARCFSYVLNRSVNFSEMGRYLRTWVIIRSINRNFNRLWMSFSSLRHERSAVRQHWVCCSFDDHFINRLLQFCCCFASAREIRKSVLSRFSLSRHANHRKHSLYLHVRHTRACFCSDEDGIEIFLQSPMSSREWTKRAFYLEMKIKKLVRCDAYRQAVSLLTIRALEDVYETSEILQVSKNNSSRIEILWFNFRFLFGRTWLSFGRVPKYRRAVFEATFRQFAEI